MLQPPENKNAAPPASNPNTYTPVKASSAPMEQATIGRSLVIKGEISGAESLFVDGRIEGTVNIPEHRVTVGRNGVVTADVNAREVVIMGKVQGNIICSDRLDIRSEGAVTGDVVVQRISVEDGAILKGSVQVQAAEQKQKQPPQQAKPVEVSKPSNSEASKAAAASAGA
jgi:cytoskeletal protein CcmA (bactofilin family)